MAYLAACDVPVVTQTTTTGEAYICTGVLSQIDTSSLISTFHISDIDMLVAGGLFASSFIVVGMFHVASFALGFVLQSVKGRFN